MIKTFVALGCVAFLGCQSAPDAVVAQKTEDSQKAEKSSVLAKPSARSIPTLEVLAEREAHFKERATVEPIPTWPKAFSQFAKHVQGRLTAASDELRTAVDREPAWRAMSLEVRLFGTDEDVDQRLLDELKAIGFKGFSGELPEQPVKVGALTWDLQRFRSKVPDETPGQFPRETRALLTWRRTHDTPQDATKCRHPSSVDFEAPAWLQKATAQTSTRRRVSAGLSRTTNGQVSSCRLFFPIGESHDEGVGKLMEAAKAAGLIHREGDGPKQVWTDKANKSTLSWRPDKSELGLGCRIEGPVLLVEWKE